MAGVDLRHSFGLVSRGCGHAELAGQAVIAEMPRSILLRPKIAEDRRPGYSGGVGQHPAVPLKGAQAFQDGGVILLLRRDIRVLCGRPSGEQVQIEFLFRGVDHGDGGLRLWAHVGVSGGDETEQAQQQGREHASKRA